MIICERHRGSHRGWPHGLAICARLVGRGFEVVATDLRPEPEQDVREAGAGWIPHGRLVAATADAAITVLPGSSELETAIRTARPALKPGMAWIDMTSAKPTVGRELVS